jgi:putative adhesin
MHIRPTIALCACLTAFAAADSAAQPLKLARLYQGRNRPPEQSDTFSRKIRIARDGRVSISNVSGEITVTAAAGDEVSIDATKRWRGGRDVRDRVNIVVDDRPSRVEIRTDYGSFWRGDDVSVDYNVAVPSGVALEVQSVSGRVRVSGVKGAIRLTSVSGSITATDTPGVEYARSVSGGIEIGGVSHDNAVSLSSVSGPIHVNGVKARELELSTVSGDAVLRDATCGRVSARTVSGGFEYTGALARNGSYDVTSHSGSIRFAVADNAGFELNATSFSGSIRSDFPMSVGGERNPYIRGRGRRGPGDSLQATFGDGSASLSLRTFSGGITITRR